MKTDKVFVLLLVILLPLTGCIDMTDNAESQDATTDETQSQTEQNHHPVIYSEEFTRYNGGEGISIQAMAVDFDGTIESYGVDVNQDGVIDIPVANFNEYTHQTVGEETEWMNKSIYNPTGNLMDVEYCYQWLSLIAIDDDGAMTVEPFIAKFQWDSENEVCLNQRD
jgi:hypothetical protein